MWSKSLMTFHLRNDPGTFHYHWWKKSVHIYKEMLDLGMIQPSQSVWCNTVVLVQKKDGSLHFCIDFHHFNAHTKKDSYPLPRIQKALESFGRCWPFFMLGPEVWILADQDGWAVYWLKAQKKTDVKVLLAEHTSGEEGNLILHNRQNFAIHQGALYLCSMPKGKTEDLLLFVVPKAHCVAAFNGCHQDGGLSRV